MKRYRVIQWGCGVTGSYSLKQILANSDLELVGLKCHSAEKVGRPASEVCGDGHSEVKATSDAKALLDMQADCVVYMPRDPFIDPTDPRQTTPDWYEELQLILKSGKNVVTSLGAGTHHRHLHDGAAFVRALNEACRVGRSSVFFTGVDPGFSDVFAHTISSVSSAITRICLYEVLDYGDVPAIESLNKMGFGMAPSDFPANAWDYVRPAWGGMPYLLGDALGIRIDSIRIDTDTYLAPTSFIAKGGLNVRAGTIGALRFMLNGLVNGEPVLVVHHVTRIGPESAPEWPRVGAHGGYRVEVDGMPPVLAEIPLGLPGGTGSAVLDACVMTAARCVNSIGPIIAAAEGYRSYMDFAPIGGRLVLQ